MDTRHVSKEEIKESLDVLRKLTIELGMHINIISPYYDGFEINKKSFPFAFVMNEFTRHLVGQVYNLIHDEHSNYNVTSITSVYKKIAQYSKAESVGGKEHVDSFKSIEELLKEL